MRSKLVGNETESNNNLKKKQNGISGKGARIKTHVVRSTKENVVLLLRCARAVV